MWRFWCPRSFLHHPLHTALRTMDTLYERLLLASGAPLRADLPLQWTATMTEPSSSCDPLKTKPHRHYPIDQLLQVRACVRHVRRLDLVYRRLTELRICRALSSWPLFRPASRSALTVPSRTTAPALQPVRPVTTISSYADDPCTGWLQLCRYLREGQRARLGVRSDLACIAARHER